MSNIATLKQKARAFEQREQWQAALEVYERLVAEPTDGDELEVGVWNRIGDLRMRLGRPEPAVDAYELAVQAYADAGLHNNAIALCNKILRIAPDRPVVYLKLGLMSAAKGFVVDARQHLGRFVELMRDAGELDTALDTLLHAADEQPEHVEVRRVLIEQLRANGREAHAIEQLSVLHQHLAAQGDGARLDDGRHDLRTPIADAPPADPAFAELPSVDFGAGLEITADPRVDADSAAAGAGLDLAPLVAEAPDTAAADELGDLAPLDGLEPTQVGRTPAAADPPAGGAGDEFSSLLALEITAPEDPQPRAADDAGLDLDEDVDELAEPLPLLSFDSFPAADEHAGEADAGERAEGLLTSAAFEPGEATDAAASPAPTFDGLETFTGFSEAAEAGDARDAEEPLPLLGGWDPAAEPSGSAGAAPAPARARLAADPADLEAARELVRELRDGPADAEAEALLEQACAALADRGRYVDAVELVRGLIELRPQDTGLYQRHVELAFRADDATLLVEAYLALAARLEAAGDREKSAATYRRVLEIDPDHAAARAALAAEPAAPPAAAADEGFVDLAALIFDDDAGAGSTRFVVDAEPPTGDEDRDFEEILRRFREQVARNLDVEDAASHYDLGVAFKEMGLFDEAISEFQIALRAGARPLATLEMLGECFVARDQHAVGWRVLDRAVRLAGASDAEMVGVLYWLGRCDEALGRPDAACEAYERVLAVDIRFRDAASRLQTLRRAPGPTPL